ncbi:hypothetical protein IF2G_02772 [Cordyceps javanica]|nr:hypothetical protein IF2G_02772 [Cordyceps javanica]
MHDEANASKLVRSIYFFLSLSHSTGRFPRGTLDQAGGRARPAQTAPILVASKAATANEGIDDGDGLTRRCQQTMAMRSRDPGPRASGETLCNYMNAFRFGIRNMREASNESRSARGPSHWVSAGVVTE